MREFRKSTRRCESLTNWTNTPLFNPNCTNRRHSCLCNQCGRLSEFQIRSHDVQKLDDMKQIMREHAKMIELETKRLNVLEGRIKTGQDEDEKFELFCKKRRKSCYCSECGNLSLFEKKSQDIASYSSKFLCTKFQIFQAHQIIHTQNQKSKFYHISQNQQSFRQKYPSQHSSSNITQRVLQQSKLKINPQHKVNAQKLLHSTTMEIGPPKSRTFESSPKNYVIPYLKPTKNSIFAFKLPILREFKKIELQHRYYLTKHD